MKAHTRWGGSSVHGSVAVLSVEAWAGFAGMSVDEARSLGDIRVTVDRHGLRVSDRANPPTISQARLSGLASRIASRWVAESGGAYRLR